MWSLLGELVCVTNLEHPLPYRWRLESDNNLKRKTKLLNSLRILKEIKRRFPSFHDMQLESFGNNEKPQKEKQVVTFAKLVH